MKHNTERKMPLEEIAFETYCVTIPQKPLSWPSTPSLGLSSDLAWPLQFKTQRGWDV